MEKLPIKKGWVITLCIILLFVILNPTSGDFRSYKGLSNSRYFSKPSNLIVASIYYHDGHNYLGILKNFITLN